MDRSTASKSVVARGGLWAQLSLAVVAAALLASAGCAALPGPLGQYARDQALRKQAQADSFPTAGQVGL